MCAGPGSGGLGQIFVHCNSEPGSVSEIDPIGCHAISIPENFYKLGRDKAFALLPGIIAVFLEAQIVCERPEGIKPLGHPEGSQALSYGLTEGVCFLGHVRKVVGTG